MFRTSRPVTAEDFRDRRVELERLTRVVADLRQGNPRWLAIIGLRKVGKTSLLMEAGRRVEGRDLAFVVLDVFESMPVSLELFRTYGLRVADRALSREIGQSLEALALSPAEYRSSLVGSKAFLALGAALRRDLLELCDRPVDADFVKMALSLPERLAEALGMVMLVAIDEFQELAVLGSRRESLDPLPLMRSVWQRHQRVAYVVSGSAKGMLTELVTARHSPFFQHFDLMELGPFSTEDATALLVGEGPADHRVDGDVAAKAVQVLGGHPFYLQLLGEALTAEPPPYDDRALKASLQRLLFNRTGRLALYFQNEFERLVGRSTYLAAVLESLAKGPVRLADLARAIHATTGATAGYVNRLNDAVDKHDDGSYALSDPAFGLWIRWRAPGGTVLPMKLVGDEAEGAVAQHLAKMGFELVYQSRGSRGAFDLLATRGARQLGVQVKRSPMPLAFSRSEEVRMAADAERFGWRWAVAAVSDKLEVVILDPTKGRRGKQLRLGPEAVIDNVLQWLDPPRRGGR